MMEKMILGISASSSDESSNHQLLVSIKKTFEIDIHIPKNLLVELPLYRVPIDQTPLPKKVLEWRDLIRSSSSIIISSPAYLDNIPAVLKNGLEWLKSSGEMRNKPVVVISYTPNLPRGINVLQSVIWSLKALEARVLLHFDLYHNDVDFDANGLIIKGQGYSMIKEVLEVLNSGV